jgi:hypothetical protein
MNNKFWYSAIIINILISIFLVLMIIENNNFWIIVALTLQLIWGIMPHLLTIEINSKK